MARTFFPNTVGKHKKVLNTYHRWQVWEARIGKQYFGDTLIAYLLKQTFAHPNFDAQASVKCAGIVFVA